MDDRSVHSIYKLLVNSGLAFGARRWVGTLDRQCERLASVMASNIPTSDIGGKLKLNPVSLQSAPCMHWRVTCIYILSVPIEHPKKVQMIMKGIVCCSDHEHGGEEEHAETG